jgi:hypothetical protein
MPMPESSHSEALEAQPSAIESPEPQLEAVF